MADHVDLESQVGTFLREEGNIQIKSTSLTAMGEKNEDGIPVLALTIFYEK